MTIFALTLLGLMAGSFVNALTWRLHEQAKPKKKRAASDAELSITTGRSMCPHCKHTLGAKDLVPFFSWLWLRGKCRYCRKAIDDTPFSEIGLAIAFVGSYIFWPSDFDTAGLIMFAVWLLALVGLGALLLYDLRWMLLPNKIVYPLLVLAAAHIIVQAVLAADPLDVCIRAITALLIAGGVFYVLFQISGGRWIGGGDVKLGFVLGLLLMDPMLALLMLFVASLLGCLITLPLVGRGKLGKTSHVPFGPFLIIGTVIAQLWGHGLIDWYMSVILRV